MSSVQPLSPAQLYTHTDLDLLTFDTTDALTPLDEIVGQQRAAEAVEFGIGIRQPGFNIFAMGHTGSGRHELIEDFLARQATDDETPPDWCYVYNFEDRYRPLTIQLPPGQGAQFSRRVDAMIEEVRTVLPASFETDEYRIRLQAVEATLRERQETAFRVLQEEARSKQLDLLRTPSGLVFAPVNENFEVVEPEAYQKLDEATREQVRLNIEEMQNKLQAVLQQAPDWEREARAALRTLQQETARFTVEPVIARLSEEYADQAIIQRHLQAMRADILENLEHFVEQEESEGQPEGDGDGGRPKNYLADHNRYRVNLLVDRSHLQGAPVIYEDNPAYGNLVGRVEYVTRMG
ncbi:MAG: AAA family ATPase, partial [Caldilineaceae bacterium]|nr:AAA family ATPase [Caldilineaceae bacterium]